MSLSSSSVKWLLYDTVFKKYHTFYLRILKKDENIENEILQYFAVL